MLDEGLNLFIFHCDCVIPNPLLNGSLKFFKSQTLIRRFCKSETLGFFFW
jgi:hypothetical protein